jgi:cytochrome c oxidase assembly protein subunit 15
MRRRLEISPQAYARVARVALLALTLIVFTGAAVRLSGSGLGCPDWPKCYGRTVAPLETHAVIEYANRLLSGLVGFAAIAAGALAFFRRPFRRDLAVLGTLLPFGVVCQAVLGGFTVREHLAPGFVMGHFGLSMLILIAATALAWRARFEPGARPRSRDRRMVWAVRGLLPLGALTIFAGTAATAAGPHAGGRPHEKIHRLHFRGADTLNWVIHQHATVAALLGLAALAVWVIVRRRGADSQLQRATTALVVLLGVQGGVGALQFALELPAEIVWVHVALAALTWLAVLWTTAAAGRLPPPAAPERGEPLPLERAERPPAGVPG